MDKEKINTSQFEILPEGHYVFTVTGKPEKRSTAKSTMRIWRFTYQEGNQIKKFSTVMFPWTSRDLLLAVGGEENGKNSVEIDWDIVDGQTIECDIEHIEEQDKDGADVVREKLVNIESINQPTPRPTQQEQEAWDE